MKVKIRTVIYAISFLLASAPAFAQDLLASRAPIDKRMRSLDSISLHRMFHDFNSGFNIENPSGSLYPEWNNNKGRNYGVEKPSEYKIDLRNFCMPCDSRLVTSHYGYRPQFGRNHYGTDIKLYVGDTVRAAFSGKIKVVAYEPKGYGNYVIIRHENGLETVYGHMSKHLVKENQSVRPGQPIGLGGNTGRSTGSHLHFETRLLGEYIDPELMFDFQAQDAKADYYVYRAAGKGTLIGNPHHANPAPFVASADNARGVQAFASSTIVEPDKSSKNERSVKVEKQTKTEKKAKEPLTKKRVHSVKKGDTLYSIARKYNTTVDKLCKMNHISEKAVLRQGQILKCS